MGNACTNPADSQFRPKRAPINLKDIQCKSRQERHEQASAISGADRVKQIHKLSLEEFKAMYDVSSCVLGEGTYGIVKLATHVQTGIKCAVKIMSIGELERLQVFEEIQREIENCEELSHTNIARVLQLY